MTPSPTRAAALADLEVLKSAWEIERIDISGRFVRDHYETIKQALSQPQCPDGYVMVPREPTDVMCQMAAAAYKMDCTGAFQSDPREVYKLMISVAPTPAQKPGGGDE